MFKRFAAVIFIIFVFSGTSMAQMERFGLGVMLGEPTGMNAKYFIDKNHGLDAAFGWSLGGDNDFHLHGDYLYHIYSLFHVEDAELPVYLGLGGRLLLRDDRDNKAGVRFPLGLDYIFTGAPFDIFAEVVPILDLAPDTDFDLEGAIGARFYF